MTQRNSEVVDDPVAGAVTSPADAAGASSLSSAGFTVEGGSVGKVVAGAVLAGAPPPAFLVVVAAPPEGARVAWGWVFGGAVAATVVRGARADVDARGLAPPSAFVQPAR